MKLHPSIVHLNANPNIDEKTIEAINAMVDKISNMSESELDSIYKKSQQSNKRNLITKMYHLRLSIGEDMPYLLYYKKLIRNQLNKKQLRKTK